MYDIYYIKINIHMLNVEKQWLLKENRKIKMKLIKYNGMNCIKRVLIDQEI
jgi:hypothetical protein